jgi:hypothetical protein
MRAHEDLDEQRIIQRIRDDLKLRVRRAEPSRPSPGVARVTDDLLLLHAGFDTYHTGSVRSPRRIVGPAVTFARKLVGRLMAPILERQVAYNAANTRVAQELKNQFEISAQGLERAAQELFNRSVDMLNELIFGDQDYAIIETKRSLAVADS